MESARLAVPADLARLAEVASVCFAELSTQRGGGVWSRLEARQPPFTVSLGEALADAGRHVFAGLIDEYIVGYAVLWVAPLTDGACLGVIEDLFVEAPFREVGVGEALMDELARAATVAGCEGVESMALPGDRATKNFFESFGLVARSIRVFRALPSAPA